MDTHHPKDASILKTGTCQGITVILIQRKMFTQLYEKYVTILCKFLHRDFPEHNVYTTPVFFTSDWLNEYWDTLEVDDYRFVYMGPKGSWYENIISKKPNKTQAYIKCFMI